jgi:uncharacterized HAD superfamily protein
MNAVVMDIDGVLARFETRFCLEFGYDHRELYHLEDRYPERAREITEWVNNPLTYQDLELEPVARRLADLIYENTTLYLITARPYDALDITRVWLSDNGIPCHKLFFETNKVPLMERLGVGLIIDDSPNQVAAAKKANIAAWVWRQPWNEGIYPAVKKIGYSLYMERLIDGMHQYNKKIM